MKNISFFTTADGSPTAAFDTFAQEKMHHSNGAFSESVYIYGPAIQWGYARVESPRILSLGTGLAYNEILSAAFSILFEAPLTMASFEVDTDLNEALIAWLKDANEGVVPFKIYDTILEQTAKTFEIAKSEIKSKLAHSFDSGAWTINGAWDGTETSRYNIIAYDFFSTKAMEAFWEEGFLTNFAETNTEAQCSFATYACTGNLKRALKTNGFYFVERKGYSWKKSSTFASRRDKS